MIGSGQVACPNPFSPGQKVSGLLHGAVDLMNSDKFKRSASFYSFSQMTHRKKNMMTKNDPAVADPGVARAHG